MQNLCSDYVSRITKTLSARNWDDVSKLANSIRLAWSTDKQIFLCGNGGSAANAIHIANDFLYGVSKNNKPGIRVEALSANSSVLTCLANDIGYDEIYSYQLKTKGNPGDVLIALSGSGNAPNINRAIEQGNDLDMETFAILGYSGGRCLKLANIAIHFPISDMQISEDLQLIVGHMCMQWLCGVERH